MEKVALSLKDVSEALNCGETLTKRLIYSGQIPSFKVGDRRFVRPEDLRGFVARLASEAAAERELAVV